MGVAAKRRAEAKAEAARKPDEMIFVTGGTFRMGSDKHYPEEAPAHNVTVGSFLIDPTPVTNAQFRKFVEATGHVTFAEIAPDPKDYPGALPHMLKAGSLVFSPPEGPVDLAQLEPLVDLQIRRRLAASLWTGSSINGLDDHPVVHVAFTTPKPTPNGPARSCRPKPNGNLPRAAASMARSSLGAMS